MKTLSIIEKRIRDIETGKVKGLNENDMEEFMKIVKNI